MTEQSKASTLVSQSAIPTHYQKQEILSTFVNELNLFN